jgi:hypothetical protein
MTRTHHTPVDVLASEGRFLDHSGPAWHAMGTSRPEGRRALASALFTKLEVEGYQKMRYELTPNAIDLGLDAALPAELEGGAQMGGFGRDGRVAPA